MSRRSKGVAYVEFYDEESVPKAIGMTGHRILGIPIIISASESEKNVEAEQKAALAAAAAGLPIEREIVRPEVVTNKLFVGNLALSVTEEDLRILFEACGRLETVKLHFDSFTGRSKGFALVVFRTTYDAKFAIKKLNAHIEVRPVGNDDKMGIKDWDDSETQGVSLNSLSRVELMAKLARDEVRTTTSSGSTRITPAMHVYDDSPCVLLKNMFDPAEESGSHWVREIEADVAEECSKFGKVKHIAVDPKSAGFIYLKFDGPDAAKRAVSSLNGRFFAGKSISAGQLADSLYYAKIATGHYDEYGDRLNRQALSAEEMEAIEVVPEVLPFARVEGEPSLTVSNITNKDFVLKPVAPMTKVCCRLERMTSPFATSFNFYLENHAEASELLIMTAEKHFGLDARYSIKTTEHNRELLLGKVKTNILGTSCSIMQFLGGLEYEEVACVDFSSVKNFQIVHPDDKEYITLQSGRINDHSFNVDIRYPFTLFQALGIVLTSFDPKLTSE
ncbi:hypothetical protein HDU91_006568 [Kappamyces sp. JEL0680]|nr:hypothetical protein HDU91_006568 [Kappamyces sp. JEL0680]